ncbi:uncharacterized protein BT62DRAFT_1006734 [Guyanagaster necrorhizus]|uniref:Uncharacterized protein n=1 Tax=Guyanagaster necrorhizus TaxID=856835 RepID=A0A9P7VS48_9AGAR|nr:uncharacterized protein BT62DRAFT_1006734 [Guyanagaster necrorhizus MCA 3950]KAG7445705.1 hypothetical protein BT62DRAFT_1006734 [Guyanagaster necrorhizus MCA 3950]
MLNKLASHGIAGAERKARVYLVKFYSSLQEFQRSGKLNHDFKMGFGIILQFANHQCVYDTVSGRRPPGVLLLSFSIVSTTPPSHPMVTSTLPVLLALPQAPTNTPSLPIKTAIDTPGKPVVALANPSARSIIDCSGWHHIQGPRSEMNW